MEFDLSTVERKIRTFEENLERLETLRQLSFNDFAADFRNVDSAIHRLQVSVEAMIDLCAHFVARLRLGAPADSAELVRALVKADLLPKAHSRIYVRMIRFRYRVVHFYQEVDEQEVYRILTDHLDDFRLFISDALQIVQRVSQDQT